MNYADIRSCTMVDGIGIRVSFYVSGCRNHCEGCFNPQTWDFNFGKPYTWETKEQILKMLRHKCIDGLSVLGGEPFEPENQRQLIDLIHDVKYEMPNKSVWVYTGYTYEELIDVISPAHCEVTNGLLDYIDVLVDGRFVQSKKNILLRFRGSENQRIIDMNKTRRSGILTLWEDVSYVK